eukprot:6455806-Amphidinium_carterae.1
MEEEKKGAQATRQPFLHQMVGICRNGRCRVGRWTPVKGCAQWAFQERMYTTADRDKDASWFGVGFERTKYA